jgi:Tol biopolymer transport system component
MRKTAIVLCSLSCVSRAAYADGPADRKPTDPLAVTSVSRAASTPLPVEAILTTTNIASITLSNDRRKIAYTSTASGRQNLWVMNADGAGAHQLVTNDDRQINAQFTRDDRAVVYSQDRSGDEYYDIYEVPANGGEPRNLTNTPDTSETVRHFSPDGALLAITMKQRTAPSTNLAVMEWPSGSIRQLTHEADPKANWLPNAWSPDGRFLYATRSIGIDNSEIFRIDVATGASVQLLEHTGKQLISLSRISHDARSLLITSNGNGGYNNAALLNTLHQFEDDGAVRARRAAGVEHSRRVSHAQLRRSADLGIRVGSFQPEARWQGCGRCTAAWRAHHPDIRFV